MSTKKQSFWDLTSGEQVRWIKKSKNRFKKILKSKQSNNNPVSIEDICSIARDIFIGELGLSDNISGQFVLIKWACECNDVKLVKILVEYCYIDPSVDNNSLIKCASEKGYVKMVKLLLKYPAVDPSAGYHFAINMAVHGEHIKILELLIRHPKTQLSEINYVFNRACENGYTNVVKIMLKRPDFKINSDDYGLIYASINGHVKIVKLLLDDKRIDPALRQNGALYVAGNANIVRTLIQSGRTDPSDRNHDIIYSAIKKGNLEIVQALIMNDKMKTPLNFATAIQVAIDHKQNQIAEFLKNMA